MRLQFTGNYDADGEPVLVDPDLSIQTKADFEALPSHKGGAQINPHSGLQRVQFGAEAAADFQAADAQSAVDQFTEELDMLRSSVSAGRPIPEHTLESLQHKLNDTAIAYVGMGGDVNDDILVTLRNQVDAISSEARKNK
ncbi:MAG: hypothetical protein IIA10_04360 [Proteobacteria bacterium]|nr:hypothetical protein [Pseudomonadota bacterium]